MQKNSLPHTEIKIDDHLSLRQVKLEEAEELFNIVDRDREYLGEWLPWPKFTNTVDDQRDFIAKTIQQRINGEQYGYGIILDGCIVGHISLMHLSDGQDPEIGYWIAQNASGKGITTRAAQALTDFGFNVLGLDRIVIKADTKNTGSNRVAEKIGYKLDRTEHDDRIGMANIWLLTNKC